MLTLETAVEQSRNRWARRQQRTNLRCASCGFAAVSGDVSVDSSSRQALDHSTWCKLYTTTTATTPLMAHNDLGVMVAKHWCNTAIMTSVNTVFHTHQRTLIWFPPNMISVLYLRLDSDVADQDNGRNEKQTKPETWATIYIVILYTRNQWKNVTAANDNKPYHRLQTYINTNKRK